MPDAAPLDRMDPAERRRLGAHYTGERDVLKVLRGLFLDDLAADLDHALRAAQPGPLRALHERLAGLRLLDPACGDGGFLRLALRELRRLERPLLAALDLPARVSPAQLHGIELDPHAAAQARRALAEPHAAAHIVEANALRLDWRAVLPPGDDVRILGNPPFVGKHLMTAEQAGDAARVWADAPGAAGVLDYAAAWFRLAARHLHGTRGRAAFVATSSLTQGEQPGALWPDLFARWGVKIHFAHRPFPWRDDAPGRARVHVVILGFAAHDTDAKLLVGEPDDAGVAASERVANISPYLLRGPDLALPSRARPLSNVPACCYGSKPSDGGHLLLGPDDRDALLRAAPELAPWVRPLLCADRLLDGPPRACLWLHGAPAELLEHPELAPRLRRVAEFRRLSKKPATRALAREPGRFAEVRQPAAPFLVVPLHTSEHRRTIPIGWFGPDHVVHNSCSFVPDATRFHLGVLSSAMHMAWVRVVCGRLERRYRYSTRLVYNNFPWPDDLPAARRDAVDAAAAAVLAARAAHPGRSLAALYDPAATPDDLARAHARLDDAVDRCYRDAAFAGDHDRVEHLFARYAALSENSHNAASTSAANHAHSQRAST